ncbi:MAG: class I SAM-dependent methyltransferase [Candidatus Bathyarchaeota archaeon]|nr:class I SAM-dependent methyltransferase [Candidatus Bathyarchaeota archaeon]
MKIKQVNRILPRTHSIALRNFASLAIRSICSLFYLGNKFTCPFCSRSFRKFLPTGLDLPVLKEKKIVGGGYRLNAICPYCLSGDRERLVYLFLTTHQLINKKITLLHVAPERVLKKILEKQEITYLPADLSSPLAKIKIDLRKNSFSSNSFDAIICNHVFEHIIDDISAMKELYRVLKADGWAVLQIPYSPMLAETFEDSSVISGEECERVFGQSGHVRIYSKNDYVKRLQSVGFIVEEIKLTDYSTNRFALNPDEVVFFCRKTFQPIEYKTR